MEEDGSRTSPDYSGANIPDWAHLPPLALHLISQTLIKSLTDYVRFRAVCSPWRRAIPSKPHRPLPPQLPWLMLPYAPHRERTDGTADDGTRLFYDLWESKFRRVYIPETVGRMCCATYRGWLLLVADEASELFLFNPMTRARVDLPSFVTPVTHIWAEDGDPPLKVDFLFKVYNMGNFAITKVTFSSDLTDPSCVVMVFLRRAQAIFFCRVGDPCWTQVVMPPSPRDDPADAAYHKGTFFLLGTHGIFVYDLSRQKVQGLLLFEPELQGVSKYFLVGTSGLHLVAVRFVEEEEEVAAVAGDVNYVRPRKHMVETYHISDDLTMRQVCDDQSNITIFYGDMMHYLALCADDWDSSIAGGSMYMEYKSSPVDDGHASFGIFFCKLEDGKPQPVLLGFGEQPPIRPPPAAMWFQPSFA